jgi:putative tricarboxylic transport membrane protein
MAPMIMAFVLGPMLEKNFRTALTLSDGDFSIFFTRPISCVTLMVSFVLLISTSFSYYRKTKAKVIEA